MSNKLTESIMSWFPTLIYRTCLHNFEDHNRHLEKKANELYNLSNSKSSNHWNCDTYNTLDQYDFRHDEDHYVNSLINECKRHVLAFAQQYQVDKCLEDLECVDFWFNLAPPGSYQEYHLHSNSHFSLVYYVLTPNNCGDLVFKSFESATDMFPLPIKESCLNDSTYKSCTYKSKESTVIIFRSNLQHMVKKNLGDRNRISIAMNFKFN